MFTKHHGNCRYLRNTRNASSYYSPFKVNHQCACSSTNSHFSPLTMGQTLSEPITSKDTTSFENKYVKVGCSAMQGWRISMEDAHTCILSFKDDPSSQFFAVYDGHGGPKIAQYCSKYLHHRIFEKKEYKLGNMEAAMKKAFLDLDNEMMKNEELSSEMSGSTAIVVLIKNNKIICANVGDSRAVCSVRGRAVPLSFDHKPTDAKEQSRITRAGGFVEFNRVNGNLALSRALGDFVFKRNYSRNPEEQIVVALPDISVHELTQDHEFIVLACDGIWDVLTSGEVIDFCRKRIAMQMEPAKICEDLMTHCIAPDCQMGGLGCDNMTVQLVTLLQGESYVTLSKRCARSPLNHNDSRHINTHLM